MKGLLYKDWCTLTSRYKKNFTLLFVLYVGMAMLFDMPFMLYALVFVLGLYVQSAVGFDEYSHWDVYAHTLPVRHSHIVGSKYILGGCAILFGCVISMLAFAFSAGIVKGTMGYEEALIGTLTAATIATLYFSLSLPLTYKFGCDRARTVVMSAILLLVLGVFLLVTWVPQHLLSPEATLKFEEWMNNAERFFGFRGPETIPDPATGAAVTMDVEYGSVVQWAENSHFWWLIGGMVLFSVAIFAASWAISTAIYKKKQY